MSTHESIASRETEFLRAAGRAAKAEPVYARVLAWPPVHGLMYLGSDLFAITLAPTATLKLVEHFFRAPANALNLFHYNRFNIRFLRGFFTISGGSKGPKLAHRNR